jgi:predicted Zn-dependent protease
MTLTGMTRNGTFLIEKGEVRGAVKNLRFTDTLVRALANLSGIGDTSEVAGALFEGEVVTPPLRVEGFRFTSTSDF